MKKKKNKLREDCKLSLPVAAPAPVAVELAFEAVPVAVDVKVALEAP